MFKVVEMFVSINGEGLKAGELAAFIRFQGCNLKCSYCDTAWANVDTCPYTLMSSEEIYSYIKRSKVRNVTLTGGEPLLQENLGELISLLLKDESLNIEIETNGSLDFSNIEFTSSRLSLTVDYKSTSSLMEGYMNKDIYKLLTKKDSIKFVVGSMEDLNTSLAFIKDNNLRGKTNLIYSCIFNKIQPATVVDFMKENNLIDTKIQLQLHKYIWDPNLTGV